MATFALGALMLAAPAFATPIAWQFEGAVNYSVVPDVPVGTPVSATWEFDTAQQDMCSSPDQGIYFGQTVNVSIGAASYVVTGIFTTGTNVQQGCGGPTGWSPELRLIQWTGHNFYQYYPCCTSPAILGIPATNGLLPNTQPANMLAMQGPFGITSTLHASPAPDSLSLVPVPEPQTLLLLAVPALYLCKRIRFP